MPYNPPTRENEIPPTVLNSLHSKLLVSSCYQDRVRSLGRSHPAGPVTVRADQLSGSRLQHFQPFLVHQDSLRCLCPRAYGSDGEKIQGWGFPAQRNSAGMKWLSGESRRADSAHGSLMLRLKCISLRWLPYPFLLMLIGIEMRQAEQTPDIINPKCTVCKAFLPPIS